MPDQHSFRLTKLYRLSSLLVVLDSERTAGARFRPALKIVDDPRGNDIRFDPQALIAPVPAGGDCFAGRWRTSDFSRVTPARQDRYLDHIPGSRRRVADLSAVSSERAGYPSWLAVSFPSVKNLRAVAWYHPG